MLDLRTFDITSLNFNLVCTSVVQFEGDGHPGFIDTSFQPAAGDGGQR